MPAAGNSLPSRGLMLSAWQRASRLYRSPEDYYDHVMDRVSVAPRSVSSFLPGLAGRSSYGLSCSRHGLASQHGFRPTAERSSGPTIAGR